MLHYLTQSNTLGQATYDSYSTVWTSGSIAALDSYQASPTSRSLSASPIKVNISPDEDSAHIELLIILELPGEKSIAAFAGVNNGNFTSLGSMLGIPISTPAGESWSWRVVTGSFQRLVNKDGLDRADSRYFSAPFGSTSGGFTGWWSWFYNFLSNTVIVYHVETNGTFDISKDDSKYSSILLCL